MSRYFVSLTGLALALLSLPTLAFAHPGHGHIQGGFQSGFLHPVFGIDHVLAMLLVGMIAARIGGRALWLLPASFVSMMIVGGLAGASGLHVGHLELVIAASLIVFGTLAAVRVQVPVLILSMMAGGFALFHGYAHGAEMPGGANTVTYALGFVFGTVLLHGLGIAIWMGVARFTSSTRLVDRVVGSISALVGLMLAAGLT